MTQAIEQNQDKDGSPSCKKSHIGLAAKLCLILLVLLLGLALCQHVSLSKGSSDFGEAVFFWAIVLSILGLARWESIDLIHTKGVSSCCGKGRIAVAASLCAIPWASLLTGLASTPDFLSAFGHNAIEIDYLAATLLWQAVGLILLIRARSPMQSFLVILFFILPAFIMIVLFPIACPIIIGLATALSPTPK